MYKCTVYALRRLNPESFSKMYNRMHKRPFGDYLRTEYYSTDIAIRNRFKKCTIRTHN